MTFIVVPVSLAIAPHLWCYRLTEEEGEGQEERISTNSVLAIFRLAT